MSKIQTYLEHVNAEESEDPWKRVADDIHTARGLVEEGARLLNKHFGLSWEDEIDPDTLEMASCDKCVLGQLFGNFHDGIAKLNHSLPEDVDPNLYFDAVDVNFFALNVAYLELVTGERFETDTKRPA